jgi:dynein heavy chain
LFILTDTQIADEKFLVYINDILSSGWIPDIFAKDELDGILGKVRTEAKSAGCQDTPDEIFGFYLDKVRKNFHLALCFSPVGEAFRQRARMFPGIINCTSMDWFHEWPKEALIDVANRFVADIDVPSEELKEAIGEHMSFVHLSIAEANEKFKEQERRNNYTTPTSYLELINFYKALLGAKQAKINTQISNLEQGLETMAQTTEQVEGLQVELSSAMKVVEVEKANTNELIAIVEKESEGAAAEEAIATETAKATAEAKAAAEAEKAAADLELRAAIPAMEAAKEAVNCLTKSSIQEMKALPTPPAAVLDVAKAVLMVLKKEKKNFGW